MPATTPSGSRRRYDVWSSRYSPAARPSRNARRRPKKRRLSTLRSISNSMIERGLPTFRISISLSGRMSSSTACATRCSASARCRGVVDDHASNAPAAAATAASTSAASELATLAITSPVAGFTTSSVCPSRAATQLPPMKFSNPTGSSFRDGLDRAASDSVVPLYRSRGIGCTRPDAPRLARFGGSRLVGSARCRDR